MTSPPALNYDTYYHIFNRGTNQENIFIEERNYTHFLNLYFKYIDPVAETYAYCLLRNHFHVLVRIKTCNELSGLKIQSPSRQFSNFFNAYAKAINKAYGRTGSLFQHPFGRAAVTRNEYFYRVLVYIHQNPQKHGFVEDFRDWKYSSYSMLLTDQPTQLQRRILRDWLGSPDEFARLHSDWMREVESDGIMEP